MSLGGTEMMQDPPAEMAARRTSFNRLAVAVILGGAIAITYVVLTSFLEIRHSLPIVLADEEQDVADLVLDVSDLAGLVQLAALDPSPANIGRAREKVKTTGKRLADIRASYQIDNQLGASAIHAVVSPMLFDVDLWMTEGVRGFPPNSPIVLKLVESRVRGGYLETRRLMEGAGETVSEILTRQSARIEQLRNRVFVLLILFAASAGAVAYFVFYRQRMEALALAKQSAEKANVAKTQIINNVSHELRTPLNAIIGFTALIEKEIYGPLGNPRYREYIGDIASSAAHLLDLINDILDISAIEAEKLELREERIDVRGLVDSAVNLVAEMARNGQISVTVEIERAIPDIRADKRRLVQILVNLLSNAVKFSPVGAHVRIEAAFEADKGHRFVVSDTGIGMTAGELAKAFSEFGQVDSGLARRHEGTGLGLPLTKRLVELHGGTIGVESKKGEGTTATVRLPASRSLV